MSEINRYNFIRWNEVFTATRTGNFTRNNCGAGIDGTVVSFSKSYLSLISQSDASHKASVDQNFNIEGQAYANTHGICGGTVLFYDNFSNWSGGLPAGWTLYNPTNLDLVAPIAGDQGLEVLVLNEQIVPWFTELAKDVVMQPIPSGKKTTLKFKLAYAPNQPANGQTHVVFRMMSGSTTFAFSSYVQIGNEEYEFTLDVNQQCTSFQMHHYITGSLSSDDTAIVAYGYVQVTDLQNYHD